MANTRIKDLSATEYKDSFRIAVDDETGTYSIALSQIKGGGGSMIATPVGTIIAWTGLSSDNKIPEGYLICNGQEVSKSEYSDLYNVVGDKFGTASSSDKFKLPLLTDERYLQGNLSAGTNIDAGLPQHQHSFSPASHYMPIYATGHGDTSGGQNWENVTLSVGDVIGSDIYGKSNTVTPKSMTVIYLICYKANCVSYVIETGKFYSGTGKPSTGTQTNDSWYRLYSDGWCEQGCYGGSEITFYYSFKDTNYTITASGGLAVYDKKTTGFKITGSPSNNTGLEAKGFIH